MSLHNSSSSSSSRWILRGVAFGVFLGVMSGQSYSHAQQAEALALPAGLGPRAVEPTILSAEVCARCHQTGQEMESPRLVLHDEFKTWKSFDRHSRAFTTLISDRSREIGARLYGDKVDVSTLKECLTCHGTDAEVPHKEPGFTINQDGVSCVVCHGTSHAWVVEHALGSYESWMTRSAQEKSNKFGMNDLREPLTKARLCLSCHVGDPGSGKVIPHAMYAAGHPPLATIDLTESSRLFPKHWLNADKTPYIRQVRPQIQRDGYHFVEGEFKSTRNVLVSALAQLDSEMTAFGSSRSKGTLVDFARYECASCHRELPAVSDAIWHQRVMGTSTQGRPNIPLWPNHLITLGFVGGQAGLRLAVEANIRTFVNLRKSPFADQGSQKVPVWSLDGESKTWLDGRSRRTYDRQDSVMIVKMICAIGDSESLDFRSARQLAWSIWSITTELEGDRTKDPQLLSLFVAFDTELALSLFIAPESDTEKQSISWIEAEAKFDATRIRARFVELRHRLDRQQ